MNRLSFNDIKLSDCVLLLLGSGILAFGLCHIHSYSGITEGGILGLTLLLQHLLGISPAVSSLILNILCYIIAWRLLGRSFIIYSAIACGGFSAAYALCECLPPLFPCLAEHPLAAALLGAVFVGVGIGLCLRAGGAPGGDDALAMSLSHLTHIDIRWLYMAGDILILCLSLCYIPFERIAYSLITVLLSGQLIGFVKDMRLPQGKNKGKTDLPI